MSSTPPVVLAINVSDPTGGSGLETDQRVLALHGCYALTTTTALLLHNRLEEFDALYTPPAFLRRQLESVLRHVEVDVVQVGLLGGRENVEVVTDVLRKWQQSETGKGRSGCIVLSLVSVSTGEEKSALMRTVGSVLKWGKSSNIQRCADDNKGRAIATDDGRDPEYNRCSISSPSKLHGRYSTSRT